MSTPSLTQIELKEFGVPSYLGTVETTKNNATCSVPFLATGAALGEQFLLLQAATDTRVAFGATSAVAAGATDVLLLGGERVLVRTNAAQKFVASSGGSLLVYAL